MVRDRYQVTLDDLNWQVAASFTVPQPQPRRNGKAWMTYLVALGIIEVR